MRSTLLLAAAMLAAAPAAAQQHAAPQAPAVEIDPCTGKPVETADEAAAGTQAVSGAAHGTAHAHPAGSHAGAAQGSAPAAGSTASSATPATAASSTSASGQGMTSATSASGSAISPSGTSGTAASSTSAGGPGMTSATSASGSAVSPAGTPGTAASSTSAGGQGMTSATSASGSAISPTGTPGTAASSTFAGGQGMTPATSDTSTDPVDPRNAARNRKAMALGMGRLGDQVRLGPAASVSVPTALGVDGGEMFFGVAYQGRTRYTHQDDAAAVAGFGIGTRRVLALEVALTTYSTFRGAPLETGGVSVKVHRALPGHSSIAVGYENALLWGGSDDDGSLYAVASRQLNLRDDPGAPLSTAVATLGVGNGRFRFEDDYAAGRETVNLFAALGVRVTGPLSVVADWTGQDLNAAASLTPIPRLPLVVTAGLADLTGSAGDGVRPILSLGYGLALRQPF